MVNTVSSWRGKKLRAPAWNALCALQPDLERWFFIHPPMDWLWYIVYTTHKMLNNQSNKHTKDIEIGQQICVHCLNSNLHVNAGSFLCCACHDGHFAPAFSTFSVSFILVPVGSAFVSVAILRKKKWNRAQRQTLATMQEKAATSNICHRLGQFLFWVLSHLVASVL